jgi:hypothetical protein
MDRAQPSNSRRRRTWSRLGDLGRMPTEYEIVTHGMNHTVRGDGGLPLEMGASRHGNRWLQKYRDGVSLQVDTWDGFRDPHQVTYRRYNRMQDEAETFVDQVLDRYAGTELSPQWTARLGELLTPQRYPGHGLQMLAAYICQMAPSSYVANAAAFQAADELRRVQRIAYRTKQLMGSHQGRGYDRQERTIWEQMPRWQPIRKTLERTLITYGWDECFVVTNLVIKPLFDRLFAGELAAICRAQGDELDALLLSNLQRDSLRSQTWSGALSLYAIERRPGNRDVMRGYIDRWRPLARSMVQGAAPMLADAGGGDAAAITRRCESALEELHQSAGLGI